MDDDSEDDNDTTTTCGTASTIAAAIVADLQQPDFESDFSRKVLKALQASQHVQEGSDQFTKFVDTVIETVYAAIDLGKHRGEGSLATGSKLWRQRFVQAHRSFLGLFMSPARRLDLWHTSRGRCTRSQGQDVDAERFLTFDIVIRCIPLAVELALAMAYPAKEPSRGEAIIREALGADDYGRFDSITLSQLQYLGGKRNGTTGITRSFPQSLST